ncbi:PorV/PorQ family protein [bacterium]|nr:PorV/PorQ family protein [bacterium]
MRWFRWITILSLFIMLHTSWGDRARGAVLFLTIGPGARAAGMGEAFVAIADDPTATYWNPAGLGRYPLSSRWYDFDLPDEKAKYFAAVKTARADVDFRKYDIWAAGKSSLWMLRRDKWHFSEKYTVTDPEGQSIHSILYEFADLETYDSNYVSNVLAKKTMDFNNLTDTIVPAEKEIEIPFIYFVPDSITALVGAGKSLWIGTRHGLYRYSRGIWRRENTKGSPANKPITVLAVDDNENLWVGTDGGIFIRRGTQWSSYTSANGLPSSKITAIFTKNHRDVWIATARGPAHYNGASWKTEYSYSIYDRKKNLSSNTDTSNVDESIEEITWDDVVEELFGTKGTQRKRLLIETLRTQNDALNKDKPPENITVPYNILFPDDITSIYVDKFDNVWFGSKLGLVRFDGKRWKVFGWKAETIEEPTTLEDWVNSKWADQSDATKKMLVEKIRGFGFINNTKFDKGEVVEYPANPASGNAFDIGKGFMKNDVLIASEYGLLRYYPNLHQFRYQMAGGLSKKIVYYLKSMGGEFLFGMEGKLKVYSQGKPGISLMHVQWLPELASDIYYEYLSGVYYLENWGTIGGAVTYISLGKSDQVNEAGEVLGGFYSYETAITASYGARVVPNLYAGLNVKFIYSALAPQVYVGHEKKSGTGNSFAVDAGILYDGPFPGLSFGACVQHLGPDIHYIDAAQADPLPRNLKVGAAYRILNTDYQKLLVAADVDKEIIKFKQPENPWALEWRYAVKRIGLEYSYSNFFSLRGGYIIDYDYYPKKDAVDKVSKEDYVYDPDDYIATNYYTFGVGLHYGSMLFDFAYIPRISDPENQGQYLPLSDIMRFSLTVQF